MKNINTTESIQNDGKGQLFYKGFLRYGTTFLLWGLTAVAISENNNLTGSIIGISSILYFFFINNIVWKISNAIRMFVMPAAFIGEDTGDSFRQKVFWNIGPQSFGCMITILIIFYGSYYIGGGEFGVTTPVVDTPIAEQQE